MLAPTPSLRLLLLGSKHPSCCCTPENTGVVMGSHWLAATAGILLLIPLRSAPPGRMMRLAGRVPLPTCVGVGADLALCRQRGAQPGPARAPAHQTVLSGSSSSPGRFSPFPAAGLPCAAVPYAKPPPLPPGSASPTTSGHATPSHML